MTTALTRRFVINISVFFLPVLVIMLCFEFLLRSIPNDYSYKSNYLKKNADQLDVLFLGNSHIYYGIDPTYLSMKSFNASHVAQPIDYDFEILKKYQRKLTKLKYIILPIDYFTFYNRLENGNEKWRKKNYNIYYEFTKSKNPYNYLEILNGTVIANFKRLTRAIDYKKADLLCNDLGWGTIYKSQHNKDLKKSAFYEALIQKAPNRRYYQSSIQFLKKIINCSQNSHATLLLITCPVHKEYLNRIDLNQMTNTIGIANDISKQFPNVFYYNLLNDKSFVDKDFYDADHLNEIGAKRFTLKLDSIIQSIEREKNQKK